MYSHFCFLLQSSNRMFNLNSFNITSNCLFVNGKVYEKMKPPAVQTLLSADLISSTKIKVTESDEMVEESTVYLIKHGRHERTQMKSLHVL